VVKVRGNAGERRVPWPLKIAGERSQAHTAVNGTSTLKAAPSAYSRALNFFRVPEPLNLYVNHWRYIHSTINFTSLSVTTEVGALYGRLICGWLGVVDTRYGVKCAWPAGRGRCAEADLNWKL